ncbi:hypothetical protein F503_03126 [Ophiostoma piceae UAMH 11346]|uniref:U6 snRNA phosphodiesterase n=1 Tax=Ophiostoma piceae (strain UAMH 11346) TaxID=1262450 RepID=S3BZM3_OPHP1|nr:hypothetical protein F503_03126 [Ophiostoma piceae UAMH 11346]
MALVDYSSEGSGSDSGLDSEDGHKTTRQKSSKKNNTGAPPPLPRAFHDLYAATVRTAPVDHPSLHNGRQRAIPHVAGQWPSHLYIEWHPSKLEYERLSELVLALRGRLDGAAADLHSFLTSDLGVPLPLHISFSRPFVLQTAGKADFLRQLTAKIKSASVGPFSVVFSDLFWYCGPDSARAFLVLRAQVEGSPGSASSSSSTHNGSLVTLLDRCNAQVTAAGQPALYSGDASSTARSFHVSIAWTLADIEAWREPTSEVYERWRNSMDASEDDEGKERLRIDVESIKAKIGNVVTDIPLGKTASSTLRPGTKRSRGESHDGGDNTTNGSNKSVKSNDTRRKGKSLFGL